MRPSPIENDDKLPVQGATRQVIAPPGGDFTDPEVRAVECLTEVQKRPDGVLVRRWVKLIPEGDDLARLVRGDPLWLGVTSPQLPVFSIGCLVEQVVDPVCERCQSPIMAVDVRSDGMAYWVHAWPVPDSCRDLGPEVKTVDLDPPPPLPDPRWKELVIALVSSDYEGSVPPELADLLMEAEAERETRRASRGHA